jgi:signal transduction histidine kinase
LPDRVTEGMGLTSMRERADELGGTCHIQPRAGGGTRVTVELPIGPAEDG